MKGTTNNMGLKIYLNSSYNSLTTITRLEKTTTICSYILFAKNIRY